MESRIDRASSLHSLMDTMWVSCSMTHVVSKNLSMVGVGGASVLLETPLYLLQVNNDLLDSFRDKVQEMVAQAGMEEKEEGWEITTKHTARFTLRGTPVEDKDDKDA